LKALSLYFSEEKSNKVNFNQWTMTLHFLSIYQKLLGLLGSDFPSDNLLMRLFNYYKKLGFFKAFSIRLSII
jgi:hypothetical protein